MLTVRLLCVGRLKERFYTDAFAEYTKRLGRYCSFEPEELPELGDLEREACQLERRIPPQSCVIAMCVEGKLMSSPALAGLLQARMSGGCSRLCVLIGGSDGLAERLKQRADVRLSMSPMTFPHHLARVMTAEQLYRAFTILSGEKYHK